MARRQPNHRYETQPQHFGAAPYQYRYGTATGSLKNPPYWEPEMAHDSHYPYHADEWAKDARGWRAATEVAEIRHGQLLIMSLGGAARRLFDDMEAEEKQYGVDFPNGNGQFVHMSAVEFVIRIVIAHFPVHAEARMLRKAMT